MKVRFESRFAKDLRDIQDGKVLAKIKALALECKEAKSLAEIQNLKKLRGFEAFYRIRVGNYRLGLEVVGDELVFTRCLHRKDIYKYFP